MSHYLQKGGLVHLLNSFGPGQPAQSAQAELGQNFLLSVNFLHIKGP